MMLMTLLVIGPPLGRGPMLSKIQSLALLPFPTENEQQALDALLAEAERSFPKDAEVLDWSAYRWERRGEAAKAEAAWSEALAATANLPAPERAAVGARIAQRLGYLLLAGGKAGEATQLAKQATELAPGDAGGYYLMSDAALETGALAQLADFLKNAASRPEVPQDVTWLYWDLLAKTGAWSSLADEIAAMEDTYSPSGERHYFLGLLAQQRGAAREELTHQWIAFENASSANRWEGEARFRLEQLLSQMTTPENPSSLAEAIRASRGLFDREAVVGLAGLAQSLEPTNAEEELIALHLQALAADQLDEPDQAIAKWRQLLRDHPGFIPAVVGLADVLEIVGEREEAVKLQERAREQKPEHRLVRELYRLGATFALEGAGLKVILVEPGGALDQEGIRPGDLILALDGDPLRELSPRQRLQRIRQFQGGKITYQATEGDVLTAEVPLLMDAGPVR